MHNFMMLVHGQKGGQKDKVPLPAPARALPCGRLVQEGLPLRLQRAAQVRHSQSRSHVGVQLPVHTAREPERRQYHLPRSGERAAARKCEVEQDVLALLNLCAGKGLVDGGLGAVNLNYTYSCTAVFFDTSYDLVSTAAGTTGNPFHARV